MGFKEVANQSLAAGPNADQTAFPDAKATFTNLVFRHAESEAADAGGLFEVARHGGRRGSLNDAATVDAEHATIIVDVVFVAVGIVAAFGVDDAYVVATDPPTLAAAWEAQTIVTSAAVWAICAVATFGNGALAVAAELTLARAIVVVAALVGGDAHRRA